MRDNTRAILASPEYSLMHNTQGKAYHLLKYPSVSAAHSATKLYARTANEKHGTDAEFIGLGSQTCANLDATGKANKALADLNAALARLDVPHSRPGAIANTVTGGFWDVPSVLAGLPLAARSRIRTKLVPINLRLWIGYKADTDAEEISSVTAKLAKALRDYTLAGGVATLTVINASHVEGALAQVACVETRVNVSDTNALAFALSPTFVRGISIPLRQALSTESHDGLFLLPSEFFPGVHHLNNRKCTLAENAAKVCEALKLA